jgi:hypothetical protein
MFNNYSLRQPRGLIKLNGAIIPNWFYIEVNNNAYYGDYEFHPDYGAGLPQKIGNVANIAKLKALIQGQVLLEGSVTKMPLPEITVQSLVNGIACSIQYTDATIKQPVLLSFKVNET